MWQLIAILLWQGTTGDFTLVNYYMIFNMLDKRGKRGKWMIPTTERHAYFRTGHVPWYIVDACKRQWKVEYMIKVLDHSFFSVQTVVIFGFTMRFYTCAPISKINLHRNTYN